MSETPSYKQSIGGIIYTEGEFSVVRYVDRFRVYSNERGINLTFVFTADSEKKVFETVTAEIKRMIEINEQVKDDEKMIEIKDSDVLCDNKYVRVVSEKKGKDVYVYYVYVKRVGSRIMFHTFDAANEYANSITENCKLFDKMCEEDAENSIGEDDCDDDNQDGISSFFGGGSGANVSSNYSKMF